MSPRQEVAAADGRRISYLVAGAGPALVMVPSLLQTAELWHRRGYVDAFDEHRRVIVVDPLGHGMSDQPHDSDAYSAENAVGHLVEVMEQEQVEQATLWGYGSGAETVLDLARRRPQMAEAVIVGGVYLDDYAAGFRTLGLDLRAITERADSALDDGDWQTYFDVVPWDVSPESMAELASQNDPLAIGAAIRSNLRRARGFMKPAVPTLVYWGRDEFFGDENQRIAETMPIVWASIEGSRATAFDIPDPVVARVRQFLDSSVRV
ncbi:MAG: alpha/beta hydrolase [Acidimicrobiales bacterium]|nr:alpha/beta hydrolase [Acidimicrobiales bacterium]